MSLHIKSLKKLVNSYRHVEMAGQNQPFFGRDVFLLLMLCTLLFFFFFSLSIPLLKYTHKLFFFMRSRLEGFSLVNLRWCILKNLFIICLWVFLFINFFCIEGKKKENINKFFNIFLVCEKENKSHLGLTKPRKKVRIISSTTHLVRHILDPNSIILTHLSSASKLKLECP